MKYAIWGAGNIGQWFKIAVEQSCIEETINIVCFGDNNDKIIGKLKDNLPIVSLQEMSQQYKKKEIDAVIIATRNRFVKDIVKQLEDTGIVDIYMIPEWTYHKSLKDINLKELLIKIDISMPRLEYFEYHVAEHCNLNCKGCGHFCPLVTEPSYGNYELYIRDLERLKELVWGVHRIRLMGGEPLLNKDLKKIICATREVFPDASISVVTNGLLIDKMESELFQIMYDKGCVFDITNYKPTENLLNKINAICKMHGVRCNISGAVTEFLKRKTLLGNANPVKSYEVCMSKQCSFLRDGKISTCAMPQLIDVFNKAFQTQIEAGDDDVIDLYDEKLDGWKLVKKLSSPIEMCRYCREIPERFEWECVGHNSKKEDWLVEG